MKYLAILIALIAMPALAEENRYTRINLDFGKEGAYYHYADRGYCQTKICLVKMTSAKMVLDYGISDATDVGIIPAHVQFTMSNGLKHPASGACTSNGDVVICTLEHLSGMELTWNTKKPKTAGSGVIWHGTVEGADEFSFTWSVPKVKKKADPKDNQPPSNLPPGT
ncbi:MAG: hypothetical protein OXI17_15515 [Gammaproteobacteria bacterium]|nr:hypothetical protein [Gammaproteobacteria bacterium]